MSTKEESNLTGFTSQSVTCSHGVNLNIAICHICDKTYIHKDEVKKQLSALLSRANSELPDKKEVKGYNEMAGYADFARGYNQAVTDVRTKLDQLSKEKMK
jgi:hypothetical protein